MSRHSVSRSKHQHRQSSSQQSLPSEWGSVQQRLTFLEQSLAKLQRKTHKNQKRLSQNQDEIDNLRRELKDSLNEANRNRYAEPAQKVNEADIDKVKEELIELRGYVKLVERQSNQMVKEMRFVGSQGSDGHLNQKIELQLENYYQRSKNYIDKAVLQLKSMLKQYGEGRKDEFKGNDDMSRSLSKSRQTASQQRVSQDNLRTSQLRYEPVTQSKERSVEERHKSPRSTSNNGSSRVSYLREKLRQFEQINKKYEDRGEQGSMGRTQGTVQKMRQFKNYLQQSESQLQQSTLQVREGTSVGRSRSGRKYLYE